MDEEEKQEDAPAFMVLYCSIMILLLAFFIILQSLASTRDEGMFHQGKGSFVRALDTFGLGRVFSTYGLDEDGTPGSRYQEKSEVFESPDISVDPEMEAAREALKVIRSRVDVSERAPGRWAATMFAPSSVDPKSAELNSKQASFFQMFASGVLPGLLRKGVLVGVGSIHGGGGEEMRYRALMLAEQGRDLMYGEVPERLKDAAEECLYSFSTSDGEGEHSGKIRLYIEVKEFDTEEAEEHE